MNAVSVSVKTNTVFVCKNLADAQFRCLDCCKVFISDRHLAKHNHKKHGITQGQADANNDNEIKLTEVTDRLEKALLLLEAKTNNLYWTTPQGSRPEDTIRECPPMDLNHSERTLLEQSLQRTDDVRKTVSLFTLPNYGIYKPIEGGWMSDEELCRKIRFGDTPIGATLLSPSKMEDTEEIARQHEVPRVLPAKSNKQVFNLGETVQTCVHLATSSPPIPESPDQEPEENGITHPQPIPIEPLLIDLLKKLDSVFSGNRSVVNSCCQTSPLEMPERLENNLSHTGRKSVRFSDSPLYYDNAEQHFHQSESECSSSGTGEERGEFNGNNSFRTYTNHSTQSHIVPLHHPEVSAGVTRIVCHAESGDRTQVLDCETMRIQSDQDEVSEDSYDFGDGKEEAQIIGNCGSQTTACQRDSHSPNRNHDIKENEAGSSVGSGHSCSIKGESENSSRHEKAVQAEVVAAPRPPTPTPASPTPESAAALDPKPSTALNPNNNVQKSADYFATKRQILDIVEKCVKDIKNKRLKAPSGNSPGQNQLVVDAGVDRNPTSPDDGTLEDQELCCATYENSNFKNSLNAICIGRGNITIDSQGILPPCTMICKDEEADIDELSGDSYKRFMKRFYCCRVTSPQQGHTGSSTPTSQVKDKVEVNDESLKQNHEDHQGISSPHPSEGPSPGSMMEMKVEKSKLPPDNSGLKKTEYAVLLHDETSQVQSLIDTLVTDLRRWKNVRQDHMSHAIRLQLEEHLTSSLNLLGIQSNAKLLSDSAAATAHFFLKNRRSKSSKVTPTSYFDVVKYAFANEVDRIAKSRVNDQSRYPTI